MLARAGKVGKWSSNAAAAAVVDAENSVEKQNDEIEAEITPRDTCSTSSPAASQIEREVPPMKKICEKKIEEEKDKLEK